MFAQPQEEHHWLQRFVGEWKFVSQCSMGPDQPPMQGEGRVTGRSLGGLWVLLETEGGDPSAGSWQTMMTLGFDPDAGRFIGTFVGSMMTYLWRYNGSLDETKRKLTLDATGPRFDQKGMAEYQDFVESVDDDRWILSSKILGDDGRWTEFMSADHRRVG